MTNQELNEWFHFLTYCSHRLKEWIGPIPECKECDKPYGGWKSNIPDYVNNPAKIQEIMIKHGISIVFDQYKKDEFVLYVGNASIVQRYEHCEAFETMFFDNGESCGMDPKDIGRAVLLALKVRMKKEKNENRS